MIIMLSIYSSYWSLETNFGHQTGIVGLITCTALHNETCNDLDVELLYIYLTKIMGKITVANMFDVLFSSMLYE